MNFMFGKVYHQMDAKNRIRIPVKFKNAFPKGEALLSVRYNEGRVAVMSESVLSQRLSVFEEVNPGNREAADAISAMAGFIDEVSEDGQGRTQLPKWAREFIKGKELVTVGVKHYIEIWDANVYDGKILSKPQDQIVGALYHA